jgi:hypothetical protein
MEHVALVCLLLLLFATPLWRGVVILLIYAAAALPILGIVALWLSLPH